MKILTSQQLKDWDNATISRGIDSIQLMENAALSCVNWIKNHFSKLKKVAVFCGNGNNGGDGLAIARLIYHEGWDVTVFTDKTNTDRSADAEVNYNRLSQISGIEIKDFSDFLLCAKEDTLLIDALFGYGLNRKLSGRVDEIVKQLNLIQIPKVSIDIPTGLFANQMIEDSSTVFVADYTLTFQCYKRSFMHPETGRYCGKVEVLEIGLDADYIKNCKTDFYVIDEDLIRKIYKPRQDFTNKGNYARSVLVGGSYGKVGSVLMATQAALRAGSGLTFSMIPACGVEVLQARAPEAMVIDCGEKSVNRIEIIDKAVYGIGPGIGKEMATQEALFDFLESYGHAVIADADALNILAENKKVNLLPAFSVITPHPLEFERLFGKTSNSYERLELAREKAQELQIYIVLKDHHTAIISPDQKVFYNITGNAGMAKGGSGDVLTGILTSLVSQKYDWHQASIFAVWLHGKAGDLAAEQHSKEAMLPTDLIDNIGDVFRYLSRF